MAPAIAVSKMLDRAGLTLQDFDFYEIHEAFAAQVLCTLKAWESPDYCKTALGKDKPLGAIDRAKLNVKGSSIAYGHPFAATGARIVAMLAKILEENGGGRGLISICTAGGMGVCAILERPRDAGAAALTEPAKAEPAAAVVVETQTPQPQPAETQPALAETPAAFVEPQPAETHPFYTEAPAAFVDAQPAEAQPFRADAPAAFVETQPAEAQPFHAEAPAAFVEPQPAEAHPFHTEAPAAFVESQPAEAQPFHADAPAAFVETQPAEAHPLHVEAPAAPAFSADTGEHSTDGDGHGTTPGNSQQGQ